jgi:sugar phosphate isomerase/epimerase
LRLGVSSLFAISKGFSSLLRRLEPHLGSFEVLEVIDEGATRLTDAKLKELSDLARTYGLKISLHAPFLDVNPASLSPFMRRMALKHLSRSLIKAARLDCVTFVMHGGVCPHPKLKGSAYRICSASLNRLARQARDLGVRIALENAPALEGWLFTEAEETAKVMREGLDGWVGLCLDLGHANTARQVEAFLDAASDLAIHVHAHDNDGLKDLHLTPGEGSVNWRRALEGLKRIPFRGALIVETASEPWRGLEYLKGLLS